MVCIVKAMILPYWSPTVVRNGSTEGRTPNNWCLQTVVLEKTPESPLDSEEIKPVNLERDQSWKFIGETDAEAESPVLVISCNRQLIRTVPDAGKGWGQKEKRASEDEISGWHHQCNEHELGPTRGDGERQEGLACYSPWGHKESDTIGQLNNRTLGVESKECAFHSTLWCWPTAISSRWTLELHFPVLLRSIVSARSRWGWQLRAEALKSD